MAINKESNGYVMGFAIALVVVVGTLLTVIAMALKPMQIANVKQEKMQNILESTNLTDFTRKESAELFKKYVVKRVILDYYGNVVEGTEYGNDKEVDENDKNDAFNVDLLKEYKTVKDPKERRYPLFVVEREGKVYYVAPLMGQGLWAAVWGYVSLAEDGSTIEGTVFDHKSETPGLGAEIKKEFFEKQFIGKKISENGKYTSVAVIKPGPPLDDHKVDGISGGTFTGAGVDEMIKRTMVVYHTFLKKNSNYR